MLSKHPLDLRPDRKLSREEIADALRLSIIAELDAVSLYLQLARAIDDERIKKVFEDVAREEKTHVGEFLALLKSLDAELSEELKRGAEEVRELTGTPSADPKDIGRVREGEPLTEEEWRQLREQVVRAADSTRVFRHNIPLVRVGRGVEFVPVERAGTRAREGLKLEEISAKFYLTQRAIDYARRAGQPLELGDALRAARELALEEDKLILNALIGLPGAIKVSITSWNEPGRAVDEVSKAVVELVEAGLTGPYVLFVSPTRFAKLVAVHERTGVMELTRVKALVKDVVPTPTSPDDLALIIVTTPQVLDLTIGGDMEIDYIGPEDGAHTFRLWETLALRVRYDRGIAILRQQS